MVLFGSEFVIYEVWEFWFVADLQIGSLIL